MGLGKRLIWTLRERLAAMGVPGLHLNMSRDNDNAYRFYRHIGFEQIAVDGGSPTTATFAMRTGAGT
jgi:ribosomal protein S18 acetylase RimI-like enzyme